MKIIDIKKEIEKSMKIVAKQASEIVIKKIKDSGFYNTGKLVNSINTIVVDLNNLIEVYVNMLDYGFILNDGVHASRIPYNPNIRTGAKISKYIQGLIFWVKSKLGLYGDNAIGVAFAVANKHSKVGLSTLNSRRFSKTGKRQGFINDANKEIQLKVDSIFAKYIDNVIFKYLLSELEKTS